LLYLPLERKTKGIGGVTGIAAGKERESEKGRGGGQREGDGQGKWGRHIFQAPHKERGKGKRSREWGRA
jgi:hypothetical protein